MKGGVIAMKDYKILLVCSGGMSTTILMTKMQKYAEEKGFSLEIDACSAAVCQDKASHYDVVLLGPQIAYQKSSISAKLSNPVASIQPQDYAMARCENIFKQVDEMMS